MNLTNVTHSTFTIERSYPHAPERVFSAFANPERGAVGMPKEKTASPKNSRWTFVSAAET